MPLVIVNHFCKENYEVTEQGETEEPTGVSTVSSIVGDSTISSDGVVPFSADFTGDGDYFVISILET